MARMQQLLYAQALFLFGMLSVTFTAAFNLTSDWVFPIIVHPCKGGYVWVCGVRNLLSVQYS